MCSSIPVATAKTLGSKIISCAAKPTCSVKILYALWQISTLRSFVSAWPTSSNAITTTAAPKLLQICACSINLASPSFIEIEFTIHFPCTHFNPASIISNLEESIIIGIFAMSGSACTRFKNVTIASFPSSMASSMLISIICAPPSTCCLATDNASSYKPSFMSLANFLLPVTLVLSPTFIKLVSGRTINGSKPLSRRYGCIVFILFFCLQAEVP